MALYHIGKVLKAENMHIQPSTSKSEYTCISSTFVSKKKLTFYNKICKPFDF